MEQQSTLYEQSSADRSAWIYLIGLDPSLDFAQLCPTGTTPNASFLVAEGSGLPLTDRVFDAVVSGLALNFMPYPERALARYVQDHRCHGQVGSRSL